MLFLLNSVLLGCLFYSFEAEGHTRGSSFTEATRFRQEGRRQLMEDGGGNGDSGVIETRDCVPLNNVAPAVIQNANSDNVCLTNSCGGGCCRIFSWLLCDTSNDFSRLACVCNENTETNSPTRAPSVPPTMSPTATPEPTDVPSSPPSKAPTSSPTDRPTMKPTLTSKPSESPSRGPTASPSSSPSPDPTASPSSSPSASPTNPPSPSPSESPSSSPSATPSLSPTITPYITQNTLDEAGNPVRSSKCIEAPNKLQFIQKGAFSFRYELYVPIEADPATTVQASTNDQIHDEIARKFMKCGFEADDLWIVESQEHMVESDSDCRGATPPNEKCSVVRATDTIWVFDSPSNRRSLQTNQAVVDTVTDINSFLNNAMSDGIFNGVGNVTQLVYINDGSNPIITKSPTKSPVTSPPTIPPKSNTDEIVNSPTSEIGDGNEGGLTTQTTIGIVIAAVGLILVVLILVLVNRRKKDKDYEQDKQQEQREYLEKAEMDIVQQMTSLEEHVEIDSMPGEVVVSHDDPYTSPTHRSPKAPLHSQDELDHAFGNHRGFKSNSPKKNRKYHESDTVDL